ncbi:PNK3P-domain-containing protein [Massarina eburnea CBS 473.64]|uniref:PNK3P-domain-containing protein n=1 Tax=Massarina eburnea CBS 473.64 TaxID=1395130 RepID=A0A6A6RM38_9PLEO|nr:PNK3P-domain-containing protein [Massarina eburnea CBS 473.64]
MSGRRVLGKRQSSNDRDVSPPPTKRKQTSTTTSKAVANFFTPASKKEKEVDQMSWRIVHETLLIGRFGAANVGLGKGQRKIAAFDFDSTLIRPASDRKFAKDAADWKWWDSSVPKKLRKLHDDGYLVAIVSNQAGITLTPDPKKIKSDKKRLADFKSKVGAVFEQLDLPISIYAATAHDGYRKPRPGMWKELLEDYDLEEEGAVDLKGSLFVGDAAGREAAGKSPKDFSCGDRNFATNVGIPFHTPEEYFLEEAPRPFVRTFDPSAFLQDLPPPSGDPKYTKNNSLDIVLFVGSPGSGKSSFYRRHLQPLGYGRVNQDILKSREKCLKAATALLEEKTSVVVDNTNADAATRADWTALGMKMDVPVRCILFTAPAKLCEHNDIVRALNTGEETNPESRVLLPKMAFSGFAKRYGEPQLAEGFQDIVKIGFEFEGTEESRKLWSMFWL